MKIHPLGAESFHAYGRTVMKLIVACRSFANAPKNGRAEKSHYCPPQAIKWFYSISVYFFMS